MYDCLAKGIQSDLSFDDLQISKMCFCYSSTYDTSQKVRTQLQPPQIIFPIDCRHNLDWSPKLQLEDKHPPSLLRSCVLHPTTVKILTVLHKHTRHQKLSKLKGTEYNGSISRRSNIFY